MSAPIHSSNIDLDAVDICVDTALSWEGTFPPPGPRDWLAWVWSDVGEHLVLVSRRYTSATREEARDLAADAVAERYGAEVGATQVRRVVGGAE